MSSDLLHHQLTQLPWLVFSLLLSSWPLWLLLSAPTTSPMASMDLPTVATTETTMMPDTVPDTEATDSNTATREGAIPTLETSMTTTEAAMPITEATTDTTVLPVMVPTTDSNMLLTR